MSFGTDKTIRILLVDDHKSFTDGLAMVINSQKPAMEVVGQTALPADAIALARREKPDIVLLDIDLGAMLSLEILPDLLKQSGAKILILTGLYDPELHDRAILAGARGVLLKHESAKTILRAIEKVYQGEIWVDNKTLLRVLYGSNNQLSDEAKESNSNERRKIAELTAREREIINALLTFNGSTNEEISRQLFISTSTLKNHLTTIYSKLEVKNRVQLMKYALNHKIEK